MQHSTSVTLLSGGRLAKAPSGTTRSLVELIPHHAGSASTQERYTWGPAGVPLELVGDAPGVALPAWAQRRLGRTALSLLRQFIAWRGAGRHWIYANHAWLAKQLGCCKASVENGVRRLAAAGLVDRALTRKHTTAGWTSRLRLQVYGAIDHGELLVPVRVLQWCAEQPAHGGDRRSSLGHRGVQHGDTTTTAQGLSASSLGVNQILDLKGNAPSSAKAEEGRAGVPARHLFMIDTKTITKTVINPPKLKGDPNKPTTGLSPERAARVEAENRAVRHQWVRLLCVAYNEAHERVFGNRGFYKIPSDSQEVEFCSIDPVTKRRTKAPVAPANTPTPETWKHYDRLFRAAEALAERDIPPVLWAVWVMSKWNKPRGITAAFIATQVHHSGYRHLFRKESGYGYGASAVQWHVERVHIEMMYRNREQRHRASGRFDHCPPNSIFMGFEKWYADLRKEEIAQGAVDPMDRFPRVAAKAQLVDPAAVRTPEMQASIERMYRLRERNNRARGVTHLYGFEKWYAELRRKEIAAGMIDPLAALKKGDA